MKKVFTCVIVLILTGFCAVAQNYTYHLDDKEGMRVFLRQPSSVAGKINAEFLGLQISDTLNWKDSDAWIPKVTGFTWKLYDYYRVSKIDCSNKKVAGHLNGERWPRLETLHCYDNEITAIDVSKNVHLQHLACDNNPLQSLNVNGAAALRTLYCQKVGLTTLDLSTNVNLANLDCANNLLTELDISNCPALTMVYCYNNKITALDVSNNSNLGEVRCENNQISEFDASAIHSLVNLNISNNPPLTALYLDDNKLTGLNVSGNKNIKTLYCNNNKIKSLTLSEAVDLIELECANNAISNLDVTKNTKLVTLACHGNEISSLVLSNNTELKHLNCSRNWLVALDITRNSKLETFQCHRNQILLLNVSNAVDLTELGCSENRLTKLDITKNPKLTLLDFSGNSVPEIDLRQNILLEQLDCSKNKVLANLNIANNPLLSHLNCAENMLKSIVGVENCQLTFLNCERNMLLFSELYLAKNDSLTTFKYAPQKICPAPSPLHISETIDLSKEFSFDDKNTTFSWAIYQKNTDKSTPISLQGQDGIFLIPQVDFTGRTLRCKMSNALFPDFKKDSLVYEITITGTGIEELQSAVTIYPNPTDGKVVIQDIEANIEKIQLFDMSGRMVFETRQTTFDIFHLPTATYFIQIRTDEGILTRKITKR